MVAGSGVGMGEAATDGDGALLGAALAARLPNGEGLALDPGCWAHPTSPSATTSRKKRGATLGGFVTCAS